MAECFLEAVTRALHQVSSTDRCNIIRQTFLEIRTSGDAGAGASGDAGAGASGESGDGASGDAGAGASGESGAGASGLKSKSTPDYCGELSSVTIEKHGVRMVIPQAMYRQHAFDFRKIEAPSVIPSSFMPCGFSIQALPEEVVFEDKVSISIPAHYGVKYVLRSRRRQGDLWWEVLDSVNYDCIAGCVTFEVYRFCDFVPVWPKDGAAVPIRIQPLWHRGSK